MWWVNDSPHDGNMGCALLYIICKCAKLFFEHRRKMLPIDIDYFLLLIECA